MDNNISIGWNEAMNNTCMYLYTPPWSWLLTYIPVYFRYSKCNDPRELFLLYKTVLYFTNIPLYVLLFTFIYIYFSSLWGWFTFSIHSNNSYLHCTIINIFNAPEVFASWQKVTIEEAVVWSLLGLLAGGEWPRVWCFWLDIIVAACDVYLVITTCK